MTAAPIVPGLAENDCHLRIAFSLHAARQKRLDRQVRRLLAASDPVGELGRPTRRRGVVHSVEQPADEGDVKWRHVLICSYRLGIKARTMQ